MNIFIKKISKVGLLVAISISIFSACKKDNYVEKEELPPTITLTNPANLETLVALDETIAITFNEKMDTSSFVPSSVRLEAVTGGIPRDLEGVLSYDETTNTLFFTPNSSFEINTTYTARVKPIVKDLSGNLLQQEYIWSFSTSASINPTVIYTNPANLDSNVAYNQIITATFNMPMDPTTISNTSFTINNGNSNITGLLSYTGNTINFRPDDILLANTTYVGTLNTDIKNIAGVSLVNNYEWSFTTANVGVQLNSVQRFGIIAGVGISNAAGFSVINNLDVGIYPGIRSSISGFPPATIVNGKIYASDDPIPAGVSAMLAQAKQDLADAYLYAESATLPAPATVSGDQGGKTLAPGIYKSTSTLLVQSGDLTLDAQGDPNAVWIFQIASDFTTVGGAGGNILLSGGAQAKNVFWQIGSSATIGNSTSFKGNVLALTSITMNSGAVAEGRMLAQNGSVIMTSTNTITKP